LTAAAIKMAVESVLSKADRPKMPTWVPSNDAAALALHDRRLPSDGHQVCRGHSTMTPIICVASECAKTIARLMRSK
jgi:hypothetical protein